MKSRAELELVFAVLGGAAKFANRTGDKESYEVLASCAMAIGWVLEKGGDVSGAFEELLSGARWAEQQPKDTK